MALASRLQKKENLVYMGIWLLAIVLYLLHAMGEAGRTHIISAGDFVRMVKTLTPYLLIFLVNNYLLIPKLLFRHRWGWYIVAVGALLLIFFLYQYYFFINGETHRELVRHVHNPGPGPFRGPNRWLPMPLVADAAYSIVVIGANLVTKLIIKQVEYNIESQRLRTAGMASQLDQLKTQISPHFYMNMLNNIHGLIEVYPVKAQQLVMDMSKLMRYMLYDSAHPLIQLGAEIKFLEDYLRVMRMRYPVEKVKIDWRFPSHDESKGIEIPPLLFLVFIENAFKHGVSYRQNSFVKIDFQVESGRLHFSCINSLIETAPTKIPGIGLRNIRQRLELLFSDKAMLETTVTDTFYSVNLTIPLK